MRYRNMKVSHIIIGTGASLILFAAGVYTESEFSILKKLGLSSPDVQDAKEIAAISEGVKTLLARQDAAQKTAQQTCELAADIKNAQANLETLRSETGQALRGIQEQQQETLNKVRSVIDISGENEQRRSAMDGKIAQVEQQIRNLLGRQQAVQKAAQTAYKLAQDAEQKGDIEAAERYVLNAINHDASDIEYYRYLASLTQKIGDVDELDRLQGMLELAYYRTDASNVKTVDELIKAVEDRRGALIAKAQTQQDAEDQQSEQVTSEADEIVQNCENLHQNTQNVLRRASDNLERILTDDAEAAMHVVLTSLQAANGFIRGRIALDLSELSDEQRDRVENDLKDDIKTLGQLQTKLGEARASMAVAIYNTESQRNRWSSVPWSSQEEAYLAAMKYEGLDYRTQSEFVDNAPTSALPDSKSRGPITNRIISKNKLMKKLSLLINYAGGACDELQKVAENLRDEITRDSLVRVKEYQKWAVKMSSEAWELVEKDSDETGAMHAIQWKLRWIDPALLKTEAQNIYQSALEKCKKELKGRKLFEAEKMIFETEKKLIDEF